MKYSTQLLNYFYQTSHAGSLPTTDVHVYQAEVGNADNRDLMQLYVYYAKKTQLIEQARFKATGSVALIAGSEFICTYLENKTINEVKKLDGDVILQALNLSNLYIHVAVLLLTAVKKICNAVEPCNHL